MTAPTTAARLATKTAPTDPRRPAIPGQRTDSGPVRASSADRTEISGPASAPELSAEDLDAQSPAADLVRVYLNGIGKTALMRYSAEGASGFRVAQVSGVESERELPFAGLHQL